MATLVLTALGSAIGGPVGAAIGAVIGQQIDRRLLGPAGREGPRLKELAVQTSSYGTPIAKVFGTMRVAGSVIWSTDLIESRGRSSGGKGQPGITSYSYSASFAVLLSGRPIVGVGRIWADGKLLRGAAGDFKSSTGFRLHLGGEDQPPDPLIASAEAAQAPAHRGCAYAVFEQFQLADYGNRIPSLTFEVIAEADPVPIAIIVEGLSAGLVRGEAGLASIPGFVAEGESVRQAIDTLAAIAGGWFMPVGGGFVLVADGGAARVIADAGYAASGRGATGATSTAAIDSVPKMLAIAHYDPARDYQTSLQQVRRPGPGDRSERREIAAAMPAAAAKSLAGAMLLRAETERATRRVATSWAAIDLAPGAVVAITGVPGRWRIARWSLEAMVLTLELVRIATSPAATEAASAGRLLASPDAAAGQTIVHAFELPPLDDGILAAPRLLVAAAGTAPGWRRAALLYSTDNGARWEPAGATALPAVIGTVAVPPRPAGPALRDLAGVIEVTLAHDEMLLADADDAAIDAGANLALVGEELIQFGSAEPIDPGRWRLRRLLRARRGTEAGADRHVAGERFVLIERESLVAIDLPLAQLGARVAVIASGVGDGDSGGGDLARRVGAAAVAGASPGRDARRRADAALGKA